MPSISKVLFASAVALNVASTSAKAPPELVMENPTPRPNKPLENLCDHCDTLPLLDFENLSDETCPLTLETLKKMKYCGEACDDFNLYIPSPEDLSKIRDECDFDDEENENGEFSCGECLAKASSIIKLDELQNGRGACEMVGKAVRVAERCRQTVCDFPPEKVKEYIEEKFSGVSAVLEQCSKKPEPNNSGKGGKSTANRGKRIGVLACNACVEEAAEETGDRCVRGGKVLKKLHMCAKRACRANTAIIATKIAELIQDDELHTCDIPELETEDINECATCMVDLYEDGPLNVNRTDCEAVEEAVEEISECRSEHCGTQIPVFKALLPRANALLKHRGEYCGKSENITEIPFEACRECHADAAAEVLTLTGEETGYCDAVKNGLQVFRKCAQEECKRDPASLQDSIKGLLRTPGARCQDVDVSDLPISDECEVCVEDASALLEMVKEAQEQDDQCIEVTDMVDTLRGCASACGAKVKRDPLTAFLRTLYKHASADNECEEDVQAVVTEFATEVDVDLTATDVDEEGKGSAARQGLSGLGIAAGSILATVLAVQ